MKNVYLKIDEIITFSEFEKEIGNTQRFRDFNVVNEDGVYYIDNGDGVEFELCKDDLLLIFHDGLMFTISNEGAIIVPDHKFTH